MKTILIGINSKYIHPNLAIRYLKANTTYPVKLLEYTIKDKIEMIISEILIEEPDIIGFSVYIWNVEIINQILKEIRKPLPNTKIVLGGPEVSYESENYLIDNLVDYIITNEGEIAFHQLLDAINKNQSINEISNLIYIDNNSIKRNTLCNIEELNDIKSPYYFFEDFESITNKIQYVELSRGCPYKCSYCLASLEKGLRFFSLDRVKRTVDFLISKGAKTIKFLDRSFNANHKLARKFLEYIISRNYNNTVFQFEINGDVLKKDFVDFLIEKVPKDLIRFELGIQSTNDLVNKEVDRYQDTEKLIKIIKRLNKSNVTLHLDLIAGLPYEDLNSFKNTFNTIYLLFADELQLGFLKVLKGTKIYYTTAKHQLVYNKKAPYEIIENKYLSKKDLETIHKVETMLNIYWNKGFMNETINLLTQNSDAFTFYKELYDFYIKNDYSYHRYSFNELFTNLINFLKSKNRFNKEINDKLKYDFLIHHNIKPKLYWQETINKNEIIREFHKERQAINIDKLYKYALVTEYLDGYLIIMYLPNKKEIYTYKKASV
ncbi:MAG: B12-binding domain-containing radical SAM protein [Candidatus Izimaplasma sp.]|nr:B12-binding domain-containing radical SAM protein [Candidatus Izimaplasma bacterium]